METNSNASEVIINYSPPRKGTRGKVTITLPDGEQIIDRIDIASSSAREKLTNKVCKDRLGIDAYEVLRQLTSFAGPRESSTDKASEALTESLYESMLMISKGFEPFHNPDGDPLVRVPVGEHFEVWRVRSKRFRDWIGFKFYKSTGTPMPAQELVDLINSIAGQAQFDGPEYQVALRITEHEGAIWLDLCDAEWNAVRIDASGWRVVPSKDVPIRFVRRPAMQALPIPVPGGSVEELRPLVNLDDEQFTLAIGWLVGAFHPRGPYGVLAISGEQGSAKSTTSKLLRRVVDPNRADMRRPPKNERDAFISASNSWIVTCNNVSGLRPEISDALCALATDGGFSTRMLFENDEESIFDTRRPVILNGIEEPATRSDLIDRSIGLMLHRIPEGQRRDEVDVLREFDRVRPRVLGAMLTAVSAAIRNRDSVRLARKPRMADLATWVTAAEEGLGWRREQFVDAYMGNRAEAHHEVLDSSPIGPIVLRLVDQGPLVGTATSLLERLNKARGGSEPPTEWPKSSKGLGSWLRRLAPNFRAVGLSVDLPQKGKNTGHDKKCVFRIERPGAQRSARSARSAETPGRSAEDENDGAMVRVPESKNPIGDAAEGFADHADRAARSAHPSAPIDDEVTVCGPLRADVREPMGRTPCRTCGHNVWWRIRGSDPNAEPTCGKCHEPASDRADVVWIDGADAA